MSRFIVLFLLQILYVENRALPRRFHLVPSLTTSQPQLPAKNPINQAVFGLENSTKSEMQIIGNGDDGYTDSKISLLQQDGKCAVLVMSNQGQTNLQQSLVRKYRYNQDGTLIRDSVQYFVKFPQSQDTAILIPLKDNSFSHSGGFVRYYKEVPPVPQTSWM